MAIIVLSDLPGEEPGTGWKKYTEARDALYERCRSDKIYEDVMNGYCYLDENDNPVYLEVEDDY